MCDNNGCKENTVFSLSIIYMYFRNKTRMKFIFFNSKKH